MSHSPAQLSNLTPDAFFEHCEVFVGYCDLSLREHRRYAGDLLKEAATRKDLDSIGEIASALVIS